MKSKKSDPDPRLIREKGQSLVEFALAFTFVILPLSLIFIESAVLLYTYVSLTNAAREGVRAGSVYLYAGDPGPDTSLADAGRNAAVAAAVGGTIGPLVERPPDCNGTADKTTCNVGYASVDGSSGTPGFADPLRSTEAMTVTVTHVHPILFGALGSTVDLGAQSSMRIEPSTIITGASP